MTRLASTDELEAARAKFYAETEDCDLYLDIGFFVARFGMAELAITKILSFLTLSHDLVAFDILCRGMDGRVKVERLRKAAKEVSGIGPNLSDRLTYFEKVTIPLRNKLVHSSLTISEDDGPRRYFASGLANMPWEELKMGPPKTARKPEVLPSIEIYAHTVWLTYFTQELSPLQALARQRLKLEIANPMTRLPEAFRQKHLRKPDRAKAHAPARTEQP